MSSNSKASSLIFFKIETLGELILWVEGEMNHDQREERSSMNAEKFVDEAGNIR